MASPSSSSSAPEKSQAQPLHNFELPPQLRWNKTGKSGGSNKRSRSMKSPPSRPNAVPASPLRHSPMRDSVMPPPHIQPQPQPHESAVAPPPHRDFEAPPHRFQHPLRDFAAPPSRFRSLLRECTASPPRYEPHPVQESMVAPSLESPVVGDDLAKKSQVGEELMKQSPIDDELEKLSLIREEALRNYCGRYWSSETDDLGKGKDAVIAYSRIPGKKYSPTKFARDDHGEPEKKFKADDADPHRGNPMKKSTFSSSPTKAAEIQKKISKPAAETDGGSPMKKSGEDAGGIKKSNLLIKIGSKKSEQFEQVREKSAVNEDEESDPESEEGQKERTSDEEEEDDEEEIKVWNLRPRNVVKMKPGNGGAGKSKSEAPPAKKGGDGKKKEKPKLSIAISLTKREIEEDIFSLTGGKPSRRPRRRPKNVQKQLDTVFPGLWLGSVTPESYKVSESSRKG